MSAPVWATLSILTASLDWTVRSLAGRAAKDNQMLELASAGARQGSAEFKEHPSSYVLRHHDQHRVGVETRLQVIRGNLGRKRRGRCVPAHQRGVGTLRPIQGEFVPCRYYCELDCSDLLNVSERSGQ